MKRALASLLLLLALLALPGCGAFQKEYVSIQDYSPPVQEPSGAEGRVSVRSLAGLRQALLNMAYAGQTEGTLVFDAAYDGDPTEDMASACWTVRTQDALCAYCVENIAYELNKIVTINEASVYISYSERSVSPQEVHRLAFSSEAETEILEAMRRGDERIALLVGRSAFSGDDMAAQVLKSYRENPTVVPKEPSCTVTIFSGTGMQKLYELIFHYGLSREELEGRVEALRLLEPFAELDTESLSPAMRAYEAMNYLLENCAMDGESDQNTAYDALITRRADSEGVAFAYVELCQRLGLDCRAVYGQHAWQEHCWNIVRIDGSYYHVDVCNAALTGPEESFLRSDENFWGSYRWDVSSYPKCSGRLSYHDLFPELITEEAPEETPAPVETEIPDLQNKA